MPSLECDCFVRSSSVLRLESASLPWSPGAIYLYTSQCRGSVARWLVVVVGVDKRK